MNPDIDSKLIFHNRMISNNISDIERQRIREKFEARKKNISPESAAAIRVKVEEAKIEITKLIEEIKILADNGNVFAGETIDYWENTWKPKVYDERMYIQVVPVLSDSLKAMKEGVYR